MNDENIRSALNDAMKTEIPPASVRLWPRVRASLVAGNNQKGKNMNTTLKRLAFTTLVVSFVLVMVFATPQGRALAQRMVQFFNTTEEKSFPLPTEQVFLVSETSTPVPTYVLPVAAAPTQQIEPDATPDVDCNTSASKSTYFCQIKAAEAEVGFNAKEFPYDPKGMKFSTVTFTPSTREVNTEFSAVGGFLYLRQSASKFPETENEWGKVPSDAVEQVSVNGLYAEIVLGGFIVYPNATTAVWEPGGKLTLIWRDGDHWFMLEKLGDPYPIEWITKAELIKLAEGLVDERPAENIAPLDLENLASIEQAETQAGFDIPTPSMLPAGYELKQVSLMDNTVRLAYGPQDALYSELFIFLGRLGSDKNHGGGPCTVCPSGVTETAQIGSWQGWYWRGALEMPASVEGQPTTTPKWVGDAPNWSLTWNSDVFWFAIYYSPAYDSGREADKEMLVKIAESVK